MIVTLWIFAVVGGLSSAVWMLQYLSVSSQPSGGLAAALALIPLGSSLIFTAVSVAGIGIIAALEEHRRALTAALDAGLKITAVGPGVRPPSI